MFESLPRTPLAAQDWEPFAPFAKDLTDRPLTAETVNEWLKDWSDFESVFMDTSNRLYAAVTCNTADEVIENRYQHFMDAVYPHLMEVNQVLKQKLLASGLEPAGFELILKNMRAEVEIFSADNMPLIGDETRMINEYDKIIGSQTVEWEGKEVTLSQLAPVGQNPDRAVREAAWRKAMGRRMEDRSKLNDLWQQFVGLRLKKAANAGMPDYRAYVWKDYHRFDYSPADCETFHRSIEEVVVPAAERIYERRRQRMGLDALRPWDLDVDTSGRPGLRPFANVEELKQKNSAIFHHVDPVLGERFDRMIADNLLDLENRKNKAPGAYCIDFPVTRLPFIFENAVGIHDDVMTLLHEGGHGFHVFESAVQPYYRQLAVGMEFAEVASMSMELLGTAYLTQEFGGYYTPAEAARARIDHLEKMLLFWPYMAVVDAFQHWAYTHIDEAANPAACDEAWAAAWKRFMHKVDWSGLEEEMKTGWQRKMHIFEVPFYYIEYGLAQLGAMQVWRNSLTDPKKAVADYRHALSLGGTARLPELFRTAGAELAFDSRLLGECVALAEKTIAELDVLAH